MKAIETLNRHWQELQKIPNVINAGVSTKYKKGVDTGQTSITVYVSKKIKPRSSLSPPHRIPTNIEGILIDVQEVNTPKWTAGKTAISELSPEERKRRLGLVRVD